jgi:RNA polymerase sigma-70 factor (ECF subfamily)
MNRFSHDDVLAMLPRLRRYARVLTGNPADADDLVVAALRNARDDGRAATLQALMATVHALHRDARPHRARAMLGRLERSLGHRARNPVIERLALLPVDERAALALVAVERFAYADVAEVLDGPVATAMDIVARAHAHLAGDAPRKSHRVP